MFTNPFERKHSALRQALDRFIGKEPKHSFRKKKDLTKVGSTVSGSTSSVASSSSTSDFAPQFTRQR